MIRKNKKKHLVCVGTIIMFLLTGCYDQNYMSWTPDETKIIYSAGEEKSEQTYSIDINSLEKKKLSNNGFNNFSPKVSPKGNLIAYLVEEKGEYSLWTMGVDGSKPRKLTTILKSNEEVPNFTNSGKGYSQPFGVEAVGQTQRLESVKINLGYDWFPDGQKIAYTTADGIQTVNINGRKSNFIASGYFPKVSPDGKKIAFIEGNKVKIIEFKTKRTMELHSLVKFVELGMQFELLPVQWSLSGDKATIHYISDSAGALMFMVDVPKKIVGEEKVKATQIPVYLRELKRQWQLSVFIQLSPDWEKGVFNGPILAPGSRPNNFTLKDGFLYFMDKDETTAILFIQDILPEKVVNSLKDIVDDNKQTRIIEEYIRLIKSPSELLPIWSPSGKHVAFRLKADHPKFGSMDDLWIIDVEQRTNKKINLLN